MSTDEGRDDKLHRKRDGTSREKKHKEPKSREKEARKEKVSPSGAVRLLAHAVLSLVTRIGWCHSIGGHFWHIFIDHYIATQSAYLALLSVE
jgi:hypothetical protein